MPTPEWKKTLPEKQSLEDQLVADIMNVDFIAPFGPDDGTTTGAYGHAKKTETVPAPQTNKRKPRKWVG